MNTSEAAARARGKDRPANARGSDSNINLCQRELVTYASRCTGTDGRPGPEFVVFESVQGAFSQGLALMRDYVAMLRELTHQTYTLTHTKMSVASIGGAQYRHRYFWVAHRVPFGINPPSIKRVTTVEDAIGDLITAPLTWDAQPYPIDGYTKLQQALRRGSRELTAHIAFEGTMLATMEPLLPYWEPGKSINTATKRYLAARRDLSAQLEKRWLPDRGYYKGFMWPFRLAGDEPSMVLTGGCASGPMHPYESRFLTVRELARIMDVPDTWSFDVARTPMRAGVLIGKNCTAGAGRWIATAIMDALGGTPQDEDSEFWHNKTYKKEPLQFSERVFDITTWYKTLPNFERRRR